jgi:hypothetical protein
MAALAMLAQVFRLWSHSQPRTALSRTMWRSPKEATSPEESPQETCLSDVIPQRTTVHCGRDSGFIHGATMESSQLQLIRRTTRAKRTDGAP